MKLQYKIYITSLLLAWCSLAPLQAQITAGSKHAPNKGLLLDIKDQAADPVTNVTATKGGFILPNASLTNIHNMEVFIATPTADDNKDHIGMLLYNTNKCANRSGDDLGMYVWDGTIWRRMGSADMEPTVKTYFDQDGNPFRTLQIGADTWMIDNLRAKRFDLKRDNLSDPSITLGGPIFSSTNDPLWAYPNATDGSTNAADDMLAKEYRGLGLLYNWAAATYKRASSADESGNNGTLSIPVQGVCPTGWHLPTDLEWTHLENAIKAETSLYSSTPNIGGPPTAAGAASTNPKLGLAFKSSCEPFATSAMQGTSYSVTKAGFWGVLAGFYANNGKMQQYGSTGTYWSVSSYSNNDAWTRALSKNSDLIARGEVAKQNYGSVRCVQNR